MAMKGPALKLFEEIAGKNREESEKKWPLLQASLNLGLISFEDFALAEFLLRDEVCPLELTAAFICHLSKSVRDGHLCVNKERGVLFPPPSQIWVSETAPEIPADVLAFLNRLVQEEITLGDSILGHIGDEDDKIPIKPICVFKAHYYLQKYWLFETSASKALKILLSEKPAYLVKNSRVEEILHKMKEEALVNPEQEEALKGGCKSSLSIICGGPGTGKTYTAGHLVKIFWESLTDIEKDSFQIALAAPTGKAAQNLQKSMDAAFSFLNGRRPEIAAQTLHSLLKVRSSAIKNEPLGHVKLEADLILVDESSMIDARMLSYLFNSIKPGARLILLGDPNQLPPVEAGSLFKEIIKTLPKNAVFELKECLRAELKEIVLVSHLVKVGDKDSLFERLKKRDPAQAVSRIILPIEEEDRGCQDLLLKEILRYIPDISYHPDLEFSEVLKAYNQCRILSPLRRGQFGVNEINRIIHERRLEKAMKGDFYLAPIMISANDHKMGLFNGEVGVLVSKKKASRLFEKGEYALFAGGKEDAVRKIPAILLPKFDYAFAMSIHKSQGSEFDHVLLLLPKGSERFGREVLYTAVTRAKKKLEIWGEQKTLEQTLQNPSLRISCISLRQF